MNLNPIRANMTELELGGTRVLFSYRTPVAARIDGIGVFRTSTRWSNTTQRHINQWLNGWKADEKPQEYFDGLVAGVK